MILIKNLPEVCALAQKAERVLDVGGWACPFNLATHVIDVMPFDTRHAHDALDPEDKERFSEETWTLHDVCQTPWPYPDKFFDFIFCSHLLEDVRDPIGVCKEMIRIGKAGYIETPSRAREIFCKKRFFNLKAFFGNIPEIGFWHHRWLVDIEGNDIKFTPKDFRLLQKAHYITRAELGRKMEEDESGTALFWQDSFTCEETFLDGLDPSLATFKKEALERLKRA